MDRNKQDKIIQLGLIFAILINVAFWVTIRDVRARWNNVPPVPKAEFIKSFGLGDAAFAYRVNGIMIQNLGDTGGRYTSLQDYNYDRLAQWFFLQDKLDSRSNYMPYLAAFYFGGVPQPEVYRPVLEYLVQVGKRPYSQKWRWLVHAIYFYRYKLDDLDTALASAEVLSKTKYEDAPSWIKQMPAFIMTAQGEKEAAYALLLEILRTSAEKLHPNEVNAIRTFMCSRTLTEEEAANNPLCENLQ